MNQKLQRIFDGAEADRKKILAQVADLSEDKFSQQPANKWSISQILAHIILAERISLQYMRKKSLGIDSAGDSGLWEDLKFLVLKFSQRVPLKYKAPKVLAENEPETLTYKEIEKEWQQGRDELKKFIETFRDEQMKKKIYRHPVSGMLNVMQAVAFFREHANHHLPQIRRLL